MMQEKALTSTRSRAGEGKETFLWKKHHENQQGQITLCNSEAKKEDALREIN